MALLTAQLRLSLGFDRNILKTRSDIKYLGNSRKESFIDQNSIKMLNSKNAFLPSSASTSTITIVES